MINENPAWAAWIRSFEVGEIESALELAPSPFIGDERALRQLRYVERYADSIGCKCFAIEQRYIDRDYMEDHSVFYSKCLREYSNFCRRIHFFKASADEVISKIGEFQENVYGKTQDEFFQLSSSLSESLYLGFSVVKPLDGSPVGRTVLACLPNRQPTDNGEILRNYGGCMPYHANFLGARWTVRGLAFQQQDVGVSACATTAIWSSLHKASAHETIEPATPVGITQLATRFSLSGGRSMPAGGLEIDQMCEAIRASGLAPSLFRVRGNRDLAKFLIRVAIHSGHAPILLLKNKDAEGHAVTALGTKTICDPDDGVSVATSETSVLYVHDDRFGPNIRCDLGTMDPGDAIAMSANGQTEQSLKVSITPPDSEKIKNDSIEQFDDCGIEGLVPDNAVTGNVDHWELMHVLIPVHAKIRLSIVDLRTLEARIGELVKDFTTTFPQLPLGDDWGQDIAFDTQIIRASEYTVQSLCSIPPSQSRSAILSELICSLNHPRYLGRIRILSRQFSPIDCLFDTTSTYRNIQCLGIIAALEKDDLTGLLIDYLRTSTGTR